MVDITSFENSGFYEERDSSFLSYSDILENIVDLIHMKKGEI